MSLCVSFYAPDLIYVIKVSRDVGGWPSSDPSNASSWWSFGSMDNEQTGTPEIRHWYLVPALGRPPRSDMALGESMFDRQYENLPINLYMIIIISLC